MIYDINQVRIAYKKLVKRHSSPAIVISELAEESKAPLSILKPWLLEECRAYRAIPSLGEPTLASKKQLDAALMIDGRPHLYIEFC